MVVLGSEGEEEVLELVHRGVVEVERGAALCAAAADGYGLSGAAVEQRPEGVDDGRVEVDAARSRPWSASMSSVLSPADARQTGAGKGVRRAYCRTATWYGMSPTRAITTGRPSAHASSVLMTVSEKSNEARMVGLTPAPSL